MLSFHLHFSPLKKCVQMSGISEVYFTLWLQTNPTQTLLVLSLLSAGILYSRLQRLTIPDAVIIQFVLLKMGMLMRETCRGL
jgi:hypothetical protein